MALGDAPAASICRVASRMIATQIRARAVTAATDTGHPVRHLGDARRTLWRAAARAANRH